MHSHETETEQTFVRRTSACVPQGHGAAVVGEGSRVEGAAHESFGAALYRRIRAERHKVVEYGEALGLGSRKYELVDVLPVDLSADPGRWFIPAT